MSVPGPFSDVDTYGRETWFAATSPSTCLAGGRNPFATLLSSQSDPSTIRLPSRLTGRDESHAHAAEGSGYVRHDRDDDRDRTVHRRRRLHSPSPAPR